MPRIFDLNLAHFENRLSEVPLKTEPYSYLTIPDAFHPYFYDFLVYIESRLYDQHPEDYIGKANNSADRKMWVTDSVSTIPPMVAEIRSHMQQINFMLQRKFGRYFHMSKDRLCFVRDQKGYRVPPHTDAKNKTIATLLYMPEENGLPLHGTDVCIPKDSNLTSKKATRFSEADFDIVDGAPFEKNTLFSFVRSDNSFHSSKLQTADLTRKLMMYVTYGEPNNG